MRLLILLLSFSLILGCQTSNVSVDYDTQTRFSKYQYYNWKEAPGKIDDKASISQDPLIKERVKKALSIQLAGSGFQPASASNPADVLVRQTVISALRTEGSRSGASIGLGSSGRNTGIGLGFRIPLGKDTVKKDVTILIDFLDAKDEELKWCGSKTLVFSDESPEEVSESIEAAVAEIFSFYPPGSNE